MFSLRFIILLLAIILGFDAWAKIVHLYWLIEWLDMLMHFLGGFWVAIVFGYLNQRFFKIQNFWTTAIMTISFVAFFGVLWEFLEFFLNLLGVYGEGSQLSVADTLSDLFFDLLGGLIAVIVSFFLKKEPPVI